jgi:ABC-type uncharacterized transport system permease subunit
MNDLLLGAAAILVMLPVAVLPLRQSAPRPGAAYWLLLAVAVAGPLADALLTLASGWHSGLSATLWVTISASAVLFALLAVSDREAWRLAPILFGYLAVLGLLATIWTQAPAQDQVRTALEGWLLVHIVLSVLAYALATMAAVAGAAVFLQERALKRKRPGRLTATLPAVADAERLQVTLLSAAGLVLGIDILSGMALELVTSGRLMQFSHKTLLSMLAFVVIAALLALHLRTGVRGRRAARVVLVAYLLLTLGYPGVKFVTDVLMA